METAGWPNVGHAAETWGSSNLSQQASEWGFLTLGTEKGADRLQHSISATETEHYPADGGVTQEPALETVVGEWMRLRSTWAT